MKVNQWKSKFIYRLQSKLNMILITETKLILVLL